ncbi:hypothetical protein [Nocardia tengchongensis]|uniref:hypothetical protein n=1 Tax=Nocardia tengchongensis TaxID=2055889 RepID=UPI0036CDF8EB
MGDKVCADARRQQVRAVLRGLESLAQDPKHQMFVELLGAGLDDPSNDWSPLVKVLEIAGEEHGHEKADMIADWLTAKLLVHEDTRSWLLEWLFPDGLPSGSRCAGCGKRLPAPSTRRGRPRKYCHDQCKRAHRAEKHRTNGAL